MVELSRSEPGEVHLVDTFGAARRRGHVLERPGARTNARLGADVEHVLSIDGTALRIAPLRHPGWGRSGLAYGPFTPEPGLALCVHVLNGHQASESYTIRSIRSQLLSWLRGSHTKPLARRVPELLTNRRRQSPVRRWRDWILHWREEPGDLLNENLAVGFFAVPSPSGPEELAAAFTVVGTGSGNGELTVRTTGEQLPVVDRITNIPFHLVVVVRDDAVAYYASSLAHARGAAAHPTMRPLAVAPGRPHAPVYAGVQQHALGEIGFSVDSRVYGVAVASVPGLAQWPGSAHAADRLVGHGSLGSAATGGEWSVHGGGAQRSDAGVETSGAETVALLDPGAPTGLLHARRTGPRAEPVWIVWRAVGADDHWRLELQDAEARLVRRHRGVDEVVASGALPPTGDSVAVLDLGTSVRASVDGHVVLVADVDDGPTGDATGVGFGRTGPGTVPLADLEAHPAAVPIPGRLALAPADWLVGTRPVLEERFGDGPLADLAGRPASTGAWRRRSGNGRFELEAGGGLGLVEAPDRTVYTVPWPHPGLADVRATIVPRTRGKRRSRAGVVFMEDLDNFVIVNLWFNHREDGAASVSSFFRVDGCEEVYDAVWVNVGDRVRWDRPVELRVAFDGDRYHASLGAEPVLWRSVTDVYPRARRLAINEIGIVANWEWGLDTGSAVLAFEAFAAPEEGTA